jgi:hypothetical protein
MKKKLVARQMRVGRLKREKQAAERKSSDKIFSWFYVIIKITVSAM